MMEGLMKQFNRIQKNNQFILHADNRNQYKDEETNSKSDFDYQEKIDLYETSYVCLLVPRFEEHLIIGDLSDQLHVWMKDICISFGWRLKFLEGNPNYLHWIMSVSISSFPAQFMKIVRRETSKKIFADFPRYKQKNMSNEFWAPWYFVGVGELPYSQNNIQLFINQIRIEQGLI
jgi:REP element-mobilizing transposase RayT